MVMYTGGYYPTMGYYPVDPGEHRQVLSLIQALGAMNPNEIASTLERAGIKGNPGSGATCAIAEYLKQQTGRQYFVANTAVIVPGSTVVCTTPGSVSAFIRTFDHYEYPELLTAEALRVKKVRDAAIAAQKAVLEKAKTASATKVTLSDSPAVTLTINNTPVPSGLPKYQPFDTSASFPLTMSVGMPMNAVWIDPVTNKVSTKTVDLTKVSVS